MIKRVIIVLAQCCAGLFILYVPKINDVPWWLFILWIIVLSAAWLSFRRSRVYRYYRNSAFLEGLFAGTLIGILVAATDTLNWSAVGAGLSVVVLLEILLDGAESASDERR